MSDLTLNEAKVCETLRAHPHPNIAEYLGCLVDKGRIIGLCFVKYDMTLSQRVAQDRLAQDSHSFDASSVLQGIEEGVQHLHSLNLIHCDLNPTNVFINGDGDVPVIGDFDSCRRIGDRLGLKARTSGWTRNEFKFALPKNDQYGLLKIKELLFQGQDNSKYYLDRVRTAKCFCRAVGDEAVSCLRGCVVDSSARRLSR
jgi:serine/threonine protein kinase